jgi:hypothetical protein
MGNLVFEKERWFSRVLHNNTAYRLQRRLQFAGLNAMVLPVRVREPRPPASAPRSAPQRRVVAVPVILALLTAAALGCGKPGEPVNESIVRRLEGTWTLTARLERPSRLTLPVVDTPPVTGLLSLIGAESSAEPIAGLSGPPTHYGVFACDFASFGFELRTEPPEPVALARLVGDSVEVVLGTGDRVVHLAGRLAGDSVAGVWWRPPGRSLGAATGTFVLHRHRL